MTAHHRARDVVACLTLLCLILISVARHPTLRAAVAFPNPVVDEPLAASKGQPTAVLAGGCFWGVDAVFKHAVSAGGVSKMEPMDMFYGDRSGGVKDPSGNSWVMATHKEDIAPQELQKRAEAFYKGEAQGGVGRR